MESAFVKVGVGNQMKDKEPFWNEADYRMAELKHLFSGFLTFFLKMLVQSLKISFLVPWRDQAFASLLNR